MPHGPFDASSYQANDTAWRYEVYLNDARKAIVDARETARQAELRLQKLLENPPMYHLFNWSA
jgi:hypothetical protein